MRTDSKRKGCGTASKVEQSNASSIVNLSPCGEPVKASQANNVIDKPLRNHSLPHSGGDVEIEAISNATVLA